MSADGNSDVNLSQSQCLYDGIAFHFVDIQANQGADGYPIIDHEKCIECGKCVRSCPKKAMENRAES